MRFMPRLFLLVALLCGASVGAQNIAPSAEEARPLQPGTELPAVSVLDRDGGAVALADYLKGRKAALVFYRGGWCPYCTKHLSALKDAIEPLKAEGFEIVAMSPDTPEKLSETAKEHELPYTLLSDSKLDAAKAMGVAFSLDTVTALKYRAFGVSLVEGSLPVPAVFLIDETGVIRYTHSETDYTKRLNSDALVKAAKELSAPKE